jgi:hypothetical protein
LAQTAQSETIQQQLGDAGSFYPRAGSVCDSLRHRRKCAHGAFPDRGDTSLKPGNQNVRRINIVNGNFLDVIPESGSEILFDFRIRLGVVQVLRERDEKEKNEKNMIWHFYD